MDTKQLTPNGISQTDFSDKVKEYADILTKKTKAEKSLKATELEIRKLFAEYEISIRFRDTSDLIGLEDKITIYKPIVDDIKKDGLVFAAARDEGRHFSEIVSNPPLFRKLSKKLGTEFTEFFQAVDDAFNQTGDENQRRQEVDVEKSDAIKAKYAVLSEKLIVQKVDLEEIESELSNVEKYLDFVKKVGGLAPAKGKDQQKGGGGNQDQKQQQ